MWHNARQQACACMAVERHHGDATTLTFSKEID
jgi:hypothetical protein